VRVVLVVRVVPVVPVVPVVQVVQVVRVVRITPPHKGVVKLTAPTARVDCGYMNNLSIGIEKIIFPGAFFGTRLYCMVRRLSLGLP